MPKPLRETLERARSAFASIDGLAGIEFGLLVPILLMLTLCTVDLGVAAYDAMQVENAAQAGSEYAAVHGYNSASISSVITSATSLSGLTASPAPTEFCGCPSGSGITTATCGSTCSDGSMTGTYVTASATATYTTLIHYPMLPASFTFVNAATARIQ